MGGQTRQLNAMVFEELPIVATETTVATKRLIHKETLARTAQKIAAKKKPAKKAAKKPKAKKAKKAKKPKKKKKKKKKKAKKKAVLFMGLIGSWCGQVPGVFIFTY